MASICEGTWEKSRINNTVDDGEIEIIEIAEGDVIGKHHLSDNVLIGHCTEGQVPHIRFTVIDYENLCIHIYDGDVVLDDEDRDKEPILRIQRGTRTTRCVGVNAASLVSDDWTAEKTT